MGYLFTKDECKYIIPSMFPKHTELHICKLHNEIELKHYEFTCELKIETISNDENNEATNLFWANSIIQIVLNVLKPVYNDLYKMVCYKVHHETIDVNNPDEKLHVLICYQFFSIV